jgi:hypothetical protein
MRATIVMAALLLLALIPQHAFADQMKLSDLNLFCKSSDEGTHNACKFYILGVFEGASISAGVNNDKTHICVPEELSSTAMEFAVRKQMAEDLEFFPKDADMPAVSFVTAVIVKSFPCKK